MIKPALASPNPPMYTRRSRFPPPVQQTVHPMPTAIIQAIELLLGFNRAKLRPPTPNRDPLRLVRVLRSCGFPLSPALEQTAVLHGMLDNIEDPAKLQRALAAIRRVCGEDVAVMVHVLAKFPAHNSYPSELREKRYLTRLSRYSSRHPEILLVKIAEYLYYIQSVKPEPDKLLGQMSYLRQFFLTGSNQSHTLPPWIESYVFSNCTYNC